MIIGMGVVG